MADVTSTYAIELQDQTSGSARDAAAALTHLRETIDADTRALREMERAMRNLRGGSVQNIAATRELRDRITAQKASIAAAQQRYLELGGTFRRTAPTARAAADTLDRLGAVGRKIPGPLGGVVDLFDDLRDVLKVGGIAGPITLAAAALALVAAVAIAITAAVVKMGVELVRYAVSQADARRAELLRIEGLVSLEGAQDRVRTSAVDLQAAMDRVSANVSLARGDVEKYATQLHRAGIRGDALSAALEGAAITAAVQGDEAAASFVKQARAAQRAGRSVQALANDVKTRLGGIAARQMLSLDVQATKLKENLGRLFDGLKVENLLGKLHELTELFSQNTATGRALKLLFESVLQPVIDQLTKAMPIAKAFFQGFVVGALIFAIAIVRVRNALRRVFGDTDLLAGIDVMRLAFAAGAATAGTLAVVLGAVAVALTPLIALAAGAAVQFFTLVRMVQTGVDLFRGTDWRELGSSLVDGLVNGIRDGRDRVIEAVRGIASEAQNALVGALEIGSPSRVFAELGRQIPAGLAQGVEAGSSAAAGAVGEMVPVGVAGRGGSGPVSLSIGEVHVHVEGGDPDAIAGGIRDALSRVLEGLAVEMTAEPEPEGA